jgi:hypothetical protein
MKKSLRLLLPAFVAAILVLPGCAIHDGLTNNINQVLTNVELGEDNYKVVEYVTGYAEARYIVGIGGNKKRTLIESAKSEMYNKANLIGSPKAVINQTVETRYSFFPFFQKIEVTVSGHVIEFVD